MKLPGGRSSRCPPQADWEEKFLFLEDGTRKKQSCFKSKGAKRPQLLASLLLELEESSARWATGAQGRATRATCVSGIFILENKLNVVRGGNTDVAALPIERRGLSPGRLRQFSYTKEVPEKAATVEPTEHLKTVGQLQCWAKGCPLNPPESGI